MFVPVEAEWQFRLQCFSRLRFSWLVLLYVYDGAQNTSTNFDQGSVAHDFYGCLLRPSVPPEITPSSSTHSRGVPIQAISSLRYAPVAEFDIRANGGSVYGIVFAMQ
jgi:hypothetical protein